MRKKPLFLMTLYSFLVILPMLIQNVGAHSPSPDHQHWLVGLLTRSIALGAMSILFLQGVVVSRYKWIEQPFGLDVLVRFHRNMASLAVVLLLLHPVLAALANEKWQLLYSFDLPWYILVGKAALMLLLITAGVALLYSRLPFSFEQWRMFHNVAVPLILLLGFIHSYFAVILKTGGALLYLWPVYFLLAVAVFFHHRILRPQHLKKHSYMISDVRQETHDTWTIEMKPKHNGTVFSYKPGQFHFLTLLRNRNLPVEEHHFTISSSPVLLQKLTSTIKESGDFTKTIKQTRVGDSVAVDGPYGRFSCHFHPEENGYVFIAGGIGITPLISMLRYFWDSGSSKPVTLVYANTTEEDIIFQDELKEMEQHSTFQLRLIHIVSHPSPNWHGERGVLDRQRLESYVIGFTETTGFYVCGPDNMRRMVVGALKSMGVEAKRIHTEVFRLLD